MMFKIGTDTAEMLPKYVNLSVAGAKMNVYFQAVGMVDKQRANMSEQTAPRLLESAEEASFVSAPSGEDLKLKDSEFVLFQKLIDWQDASEKSQIILGKPLS